MQIRIIRGTKQIGGNIIEISTKNTKLLFDAGSNLPPLDDKNYKDDITVEGLTDCENPAYDAVFISHHHGDHCGLIDRISDKLPVYCGEGTEHHFRTISGFIGKPVKRNFNRIINRNAVVIGDITVMPLLVKHSCSEAFMYLIEADGKAVLYSGDFKDYSDIADFLSSKHVDVLISEGTNIALSNQKFPDEKSVADAVEDICRKYDGTVFVLSSSSNEPQITAMNIGAKSSGRDIYEDFFMAVLRNDNDTNRYKFVSGYVSENSAQYEFFKEMNKKKMLLGAESLAEYNGKKMIYVRQSMLPFIKKYISFSKHKCGNVLIYGIWHGYKSSSYTKHFLNEIEKLGIDISDIHTSGHADAEMIKSFIKTVNPDRLIPVHCEPENRNCFSELHGNCMMLNDGDIYEVC